MTDLSAQEEQKLERLLKKIGKNIENEFCEEVLRRGAKELLENSRLFSDDRL